MIEKIRKDNNKNWMNLLRIALKNLLMNQKSLSIE